MDETILLPSPNWFLVSSIAVTSDGWLIYGCPAKSLCVLEPLPPEFNGVIKEHKGYRAHVFAKVHLDKITSVDISPSWPENKHFITGAADGTVSQWACKKNNEELEIKCTYDHTAHSNEQEEVVGVGYMNSDMAVTVGIFGRIVKWDVRSNLIKTYNLLLSKFKPTCIACSHHSTQHVAIGTKQGVVIVVDLNGIGKPIYKIRCHDEEVLSMSWCPEYNVTVKKFLRDSEIRKSANLRMEKIRKEAELEESEELDASAITKTLPEDSFDETVVEEDNMFDIYKDHEDNEFGHKKYKPEIITVKVNDSNADKGSDFLAECLKLKGDILRIKDEQETSINTLVDAFDKAHVHDDIEGEPEANTSENNCEYSTHPHKHLLATIGKQGNLRVWSKTGKLVASGAVNVYCKSQKGKQPMWSTLLWYKADVLLITDAKGQVLQCNPLSIDCKNKLDWHLVHSHHRRGLFCIASNAPRVQGKDNQAKKSNQELDVAETQNDNQAQDDQASTSTQSNINTISKLPTIVPEEDWVVWTAAQDRSLICYSMLQRKRLSTYNTCGGYIYNIQTCPYNAGKIAISVGDGAVRIWEAELAEDDDTKLTMGYTTAYWQNVQGKVLSVAWHPTKENIVAFGTAESRVGILDINGPNEKPARVLNIGITGGVYALSWGARSELYACGGGDVIMHKPFKDREPKTLPVELEGQRWQVTSLQWFPAGLLCGSYLGSVALLSDTTYEIIAVNFIFKKMIHSLEWHPQFTSTSDQESQYKDLIGICSMDKSFKIAILKYSKKEDGSSQLETHKFLEGHKGNVLQLAWNPHIEGLLVSTAQDYTARVWDVSTGACTAVFGGHVQSPIGVAWSAFPQLPTTILTGGSDYCVRLWRTEDFPPEQYRERAPGPIGVKKTKKKKKVVANRRDKNSDRDGSDQENELYGTVRSANNMDVRLKVTKRFVLPMTSKLMINSDVHTLKRFADKLWGLKKDSDSNKPEPESYEDKFFKLFGTTNELNELLDYESEQHLEKKEYEGYIMLCILRGQMDTMIKFAAENDLLCHFLLSLTPCVSFKYWKDVTQMYVAQIDRCVALQRDTLTLMEGRNFGGAVFRKVALQLSVHDVRGAVASLVAASLYREAYVLCRARHIDSMAEQTLRQYAICSAYNGNTLAAATCYIALGDLYKASTTLVGVNTQKESWLSLAAYLAKMTGQCKFAEHLEDVTEQMKQIPTEEEIENTLEQLPSRVELLMRDNEIESAEVTDTKE